MSEITFYNPRRDHTVVLQEHQTVQRQALERIGYHLVSEDKGAEEPVNLLDLAIPDLEEALAGIDSRDELVTLYEAEEDGQRRKGALAAIAERIQELTESDGEASDGNEEESAEPESEDEGEADAETESDGEASDGNEG